MEAGTCGQGCRDAGGGQRQALVAKGKMGEGRETQQGSDSLRGGAEPLVVVVVHSLARSYSLFHGPPPPLRINHHLSAARNSVHSSKPILSVLIFFVSHLHN